MTTAAATKADSPVLDPEDVGICVADGLRVGAAVGLAVVGFGVGASVDAAGDEVVGCGVGRSKPGGIKTSSIPWTIPFFARMLGIEIGTSATRKDPLS